MVKNKRNRFSFKTASPFDGDINGYEVGVEIEDWGLIMRTDTEIVYVPWHNINYFAKEI